MKGFSAFLKTGELRGGASSGKNGNASPTQPKSNGSSGRASTFLKTGEVHLRKRSGLNDSMARSGDTASQQSAPHSATAASLSRRDAPVGNSNSLLRSSPSQQRSGTKSPTNASEHDPTHQSMGSDDSDSRHHAINRGDTKNSLAYNQDDRFSIVSLSSDDEPHDAQDCNTAAAGGYGGPPLRSNSTVVPVPVGGLHKAPKADYSEDGYSDDERPIPKATNILVRNADGATTVVSTAQANGNNSGRQQQRGGMRGDDSVSQAATGPDDGVEVTNLVFVQKTLAPYRAVSGDEEPLSVPATRYTFNTSSMSWSAEPIFLRVLHPNRGYDQDDLHVYFAVEQILNSKTRIPMAAKMLRRIIKGVREDDYFGEGQCQAITEAFVRQFNRHKPRPGEEKPNLPLLTLRYVVRIDSANIPLDQLNSKTGFFSYRTQDTNEVLFMVEPNTVECLQTGVSLLAEMNMTSYPPLNANKLIMKELAEAFSHFTLAQSAEHILVTGLQRYAGYLVDPLVYTMDRKGYGIANSGSRGIAAWREKHVCNPVCRVIGLRPLDSSVGKAAAAAATRAPKSNFYVSLSESIIDYVDACVPQKEKAMSARPPTPPRAASEPLVPRSEAKDAEEAAAAESVALAPLEVPMMIVDPTASQFAAATALAASKKEASVPMSSASALPPSFPRSTDENGGPATLRGYKYVFVAETQRWFPMEVVVCVPAPDRPVYKDKHSKVFAAEQVVGGTVTTQMYARVLNKEGVSDVDYFNIMDAYIFCSTLATSFNQYKMMNIFKKFVHFMERSVVRVRYTSVADENWSRSFFKNPSRDSKDLLFVLEPTNVQELYLRALDKYDLERTTVHSDSDDDYGYSKAPKVKESEESRKSRALNETLEWQQVLETFYHFVYVRTGRTVCVANAKFARDITPYAKPSDSGAPNDSFADACIHTYDGNGFEGMNEGNSVVLQWVRSHKCNALCGLLALPSVAPTSANSANSRFGPKKDPLKINTLLRGVTMHFIYPATKYSFDVKTMSWVPSSIFVRVVDPDRGLAMGAMRVVFEVTECSSGLSQFETTYLAKLFRHNIVDVVERDYFNEGALQNLCHHFGNLFAEAAGQCAALKGRGNTTQLEFLPVSVVLMGRESLTDELYTKRKGFFSYKTKDTQKLMFTIEEKIEGTFTKYNNNATGVYLTSETKLSPQESRYRTHVLEAAEALSHYSLAESKGALLICDIQGVGTKLTDPEIHTHDGLGLGLGNRGREGMADFVCRHRCNYVCKSLGLPPLNMRVPEMKNAESNEWVRNLRAIENMSIPTNPGRCCSPAN